MPSLLDSGKIDMLPASVRVKATTCGMSFPLSLRQFIDNPCCPVDSVTQVVYSGPPGTEKNIAVLGDGFAKGDQLKYNMWVKNVLLGGVFSRDYFYEDMQAFNIYRVNLISHDSGVSQRQYDEHGTPEDDSDDTIISTTTRDTAAWLHLQRVVGALLAGGWPPYRCQAGCRAEYMGTRLEPGGGRPQRGSGGGCGGNNSQRVTWGEGWTPWPTSSAMALAVLLTSTASPAPTPEGNQATSTSRQTPIEPPSSGAGSWTRPHRYRLASTPCRAVEVAPGTTRALNR